MGIEYSNEIVDTVKQFLDEDDWNYSFDDERGVFDFSLTIDNKLKRVLYKIAVNVDSFTVYGISPIEADASDPDVMQNMAEFITRANFGLKAGCFEMDFNDGEIRYRTFEDCEDITLSTAVVRNFVYTTALIFEKYGTGIIDVVFKGVNGKDAVEKCENAD